MNNSITCKPVRLTSARSKAGELMKNISPFNRRTDMPKAQYIIKVLLAFTVCYWAGLLLGEAVVIGIHFACGKNVFEGELFDAGTGTLIQYFGYIIPAAVALLYWKLIAKRSLSDIGITKQFGTWFIGAGAGIVLLACCIAAVMLTGTMELRGAAGDPDMITIVLMFFGFVIQSAYEEILSRGLVFGALRGKVSFPAALAANTLAFTLPHLKTLFLFETKYIFTGVLCLIAISCVFTFITCGAGNIWAACGLHALWNFCLECVLGLELSGGDAADSTSLISMRPVGESILNGGQYGIESSIITTAVLAAAAAVIWFAFAGKKTADR